MKGVGIRLVCVLVHHCDFLGISFQEIACVRYTIREKIVINIQSPLSSSLETPSLLLREKCVCVRARMKTKNDSTFRVDARVAGLVSRSSPFSCTDLAVENCHPIGQRRATEMVLVE
jgi:hypothetical protein